MSGVSLKPLLNALNAEASCAHQVPFLLATIKSSSFAADASLLPKWHARLSALLQSKDAGARWTGVCLVKATLERHTGGFDSLISHGASWTKLLLTLLEREKLAVILERAICTLVSIFELTHGKPALTREITTPALPTFCTIVCGLLHKPHLASLKKLILFQLQQVLVAHPTTFRPFAGKLQAASLAGINGTVADPKVIQLSASCFASLHLCAPKNTAAEQWTVGFLATVGECHVTLDYILQHMVESKPSLPHPRGLSMPPFSSDFAEAAPLALHRLQALEQTVLAFLSQSTKELVKVPVSHIVQLCARMLDLTVRSGMRASTPQSSQLVLMTMLPELHTTALQLLTGALDVLGAHLAPHMGDLYNNVVDLFNSPHTALQASALSLHAQVLLQFGHLGEPIRVLQAVRASLRILNSIVPADVSIAGSGIKSVHHAKKRKHGNEGADAVSNAAAFHTVPDTERLLAACRCLTATWATTYGIISPALRQQAERLVLQLLLTDALYLEGTVVCALLDAVTSAVQHPAPNVASILPHATRCALRCLQSADERVRVTAARLAAVLQDLVHPRFPPVPRRLPIAEAELIDEDVGSDDAMDAKDADQDAEGTEMGFVQVEDKPTSTPVEPVIRQSTFKMPDKLEPYTPSDPSAAATVPEPAASSTSSEKRTTETMQESSRQQVATLKSDDEDEDDEAMAEICTDSDTDNEADQ